MGQVCSRLVVTGLLVMLAGCSKPQPDSGNGASLPSPGAPTSPATTAAATATATVPATASATATATATTSATATATATASATATAAATAAAGDVITYTPYANARFCFVIDVPNGMIADPPPENGDGQSWKSKDGAAELSAFGMNLVVDTINLDSMFADASKDDPSKGRKVTLKVKEKDYYVISGFEGTRIFYEKFIFSADHYIGYIVKYPTSGKAWWGHVVDHLTKAFHVC